MDAFAPRRVDVQRGDPCVGKLQQMGRLAARRGAGIEDRERQAADPAPSAAAARPAAPQRPAPTPRLHQSPGFRAPAGDAPGLRRARLPATRPRRLRAARDRYCCGDDFLAFTRKVMGAWVLLASRMACHCCGWSFFSRSIHQRGWFHTRCRVAIGGRHQRVALAQEAAQAGVDEIGLGRVAAPRLAASTAWSTSVKAS